MRAACCNLTGFSDFGDDTVLPVPEGDPTYMTRVRRAFNGSISALVAVAKAVSIAIVVAVPWLGLLLVVLVMVFMLRSLIRMLFRRTR